MGHFVPSGLVGSAFMLERNVKHDIEGNPLIQHRITFTAPTMFFLPAGIKLTKVVPSFWHQAHQGCAFMLVLSSQSYISCLSVPISAIFLIFLVYHCIQLGISYLAVLISVYFLRYHV